VWATEKRRTAIQGKTFNLKGLKKAESIPVWNVIAVTVLQGSFAVHWVCGYRYKFIE
jgi:hypothetical protein